MFEEMNWILQWQHSVLTYNRRAKRGEIIYTKIVKRVDFDVVVE